MSTPRNAICPCGSGKKYKVCCLAKDEEASKTAEPSSDLVLEDLTTFTPHELRQLKLKAQAYDCLAQIEQWQMRLRNTNEQIAALAGQAKAQP